LKKFQIFSIAGRRAAGFRLNRRQGRTGGIIMKKLALALTLAVSLMTTVAHAAAVNAVYRFTATGMSSPSNYGKGNTPHSELIQASDGNFYGTTEYGGSGLCPTFPAGGITGCGIVFRINAKTGVQTVLFNFPYDTATSSAPDGAYPTAGLIQGVDGFLYGVASGGGLANGGYGCNGAFGCGTLFRISLTGAFTLLHQFCGDASCRPLTEGGQPLNHLVQAADGNLYGVTAEGGQFGDGTLFRATISGAVTTLHDFVFGAGDGDDPIAALLVGHDGSTLYGTTASGGAFNAGLVFSYGGASGYKIIHSFDGSVSATPLGALIYGADGLLYGTTASGSMGGTLYSLDATNGTYAVDVVFPSGEPATALVLGSDGMMYGTLESGDVSSDGSTYSYNPVTKVMKAQVGFSTTTGAAPLGALIEGKDGFLYGTNSLYGGSDSHGSDAGTLYRIGPALPR